MIFPFLRKGGKKIAEERRGEERKGWSFHAVEVAGKERIKEKGTYPTCGCGLGRKKKEGIGGGQIKICRVLSNFHMAACHCGLLSYT